MGRAGGPKLTDMPMPTCAKLVTDTVTIVRMTNAARNNDMKRIVFLRRYFAPVGPGAEDHFACLLLLATAQEKPRILAFVFLDRTIFV